MSIISIKAFKLKRSFTSFQLELHFYFENSTKTVGVSRAFISLNIFSFVLLSSLLLLFHSTCEAHFEFGRIFSTYVPCVLLPECTHEKAERLTLLYNCRVLYEVKLLPYELKMTQVLSRRLFSSTTSSPTKITLLCVKGCPQRDRPCAWSRGSKGGGRKQNERVLWDKLTQFWNHKRIQSYTHARILL